VTGWLIRASDLLAEPDPGPTPMLVDGMIVDRSLAAIVGRWQVGKTWALLELGISVTAGEPAFGARAVPTPGPVILVLEESGRAALHRRLDALARGRSIDRDRLATLYAAANQRVRLDDPDWLARLTEAANELEARAVFLDPIARLRAAGLDENSQREYAVVIEAMRDLRDHTAAAVCWVAHTGHQGETMRGSSDLESVWESRLALKRDGDTVTVTTEHREAEPSDPLIFRLDWHHQTRTMRLRPTVPPLAERILDYLDEHGPSGAEAIAKGIETRRSDVDRTLTQLETLGTTHRAPSGKRDGMGRLIPAKVWHRTVQQALHVVPEPGRGGTTHPSSGSAGPRRPAPLGADVGRHTEPGANGRIDTTPDVEPEPPAPRPRSEARA
jgi:hypothetical protein